MITLPPNLRLANETDVPALRRLVNDAYRELADMGLNYTGTYQDEDITRERMAGAEVYVLERQGELLASISLSVSDTSDGTGTCLYINQLAVRPDQRRNGIGTDLLDFAEQRATYGGLERLRLDTAIPAKHLVALYERRGYRPVEEVQWEGKTYKSYIMEKNLHLSGRDARRNVLFSHQI